MMAEPGISLRLPGRGCQAAASRGTIQAVDVDLAEWIGRDFETRLIGFLLGRGAESAGVTMNTVIVIALE